VIGELVENIVGRREKNLLCAVPIGIAMNSHLQPTIAQFMALSKPNGLSAPPRWRFSCALWNCSRLHINNDSTLEYHEPI
jgi:hypothetical protein